MLTKQETIGKAHWSREQQGKGTCGLWLAVSGFMVMGLVSGLSLANLFFFFFFLANHSDSESFLVAHALLSQDGY